MPSVHQRILEREPVLIEGAVIERLRRSERVTLDPWVANAALVYDATGREALRRVWRSYLDVARDSGLPMIVCAPTWRATPERLVRAGLPSAGRVCADAADLVRAVRSEYGEVGERIHVAGLMGCRGDAYRPADALDASAAERFHAEQARALAEARVDLVLAATLPCASEAIGIALALAATHVPYVVGWVLRADGTLLDGEPLEDAVARVDDAVDPAPLGHAGTCVHPDNFARALEAVRSRDRFVALQGNGSRLSPEKLDERAEIDADTPDAFAQAALAVMERYGVSILGGCCGTDERHIRALADAVVRRR